MAKRIEWETVDEVEDDDIIIVLKRHHDKDTDLAPWRIVAQNKAGGSTKMGGSTIEDYKREDIARQRFADYCIAAGLEKRELVILEPENPAQLWSTYMIELGNTKGDRDGMMEVLTKFETDPLVHQWAEELLVVAPAAKSWAAIALRSGLKIIIEKVQAEREADAVREAAVMRDRLPQFGRFG